MSFDLLARHYRWMEWALAGRKLQRCRTAFLERVKSPRRALLAGEGNGRFLTELLCRHPHARVTCLDGSARMLACARARMVKSNLDPSGIEFIQAQILEWKPIGEPFDLVVCHFFLDCFRPEQLERIARLLASATQPGAMLLLADFQVPPSGWKKMRARFIIGLMYAFFRCTTRLPARTLTPPDPFLEKSGFRLLARQQAEWGLLHSDLWMRR